MSDLVQGISVRGDRGDPDLGERGGRGDFGLAPEYSSVASIKLPKICKLKAHRQNKIFHV